MVSKKSTPNNLLPSLVSSLSLLGNSTTKIFNAQTGICTLAALFRGYPKFCTNKHQSDVTIWQYGIYRNRTVNREPNRSGTGWAGTGRNRTASFCNANRMEPKRFHSHCSANRMEPNRFHSYCNANRMEPNQFHILTVYL